MNRLRNLPIASFVAALATSWIATPATSQDVTELVPLDAYSFMHWRHDPDMAYMNECSGQIWTALQEARFDELVYQVLEANGATPQDLDQARGLADLTGQLLGEVDWEALVGNEFVYAELPQEPLPQSVPALPSLLFAARPDPAKVDELETSLSGLLRAADSLADPLQLALDERQHLDGSSTRTYSLQVADKSAYPLLQMAVRNDNILVGFGPAAFADAKAILDGDSNEKLVRTRRFRQAVGELDPQASSLYYVDSRRFMRSLKEQLIPFVEQRTDAPWQVTSILSEVLQMADMVETSVTTTRVEGLTLISECTTRYAEDAIAQGNPLYHLAVGGAPSSAALLDYVPAHADSFALSGDTDLRPLYRWVLGRVEDYVPESADGLLAWSGIQAAMDMDMEEDLLSWVGSPTVSFSLPPSQPGAQASWVSLSELRDPAGARKVLDRIEAVYNAVLPQVMERVRQELGRDAEMLPELTIGPSDGAYPSLRELRLQIKMPVGFLPQIPPITYGVIGNLFIMTTSQEALDTALATAAGEVDGLYAHPAFEDGLRLTDGPIMSASYQPVGRQIAETAAGIQMASSMMTLLGNQAGRKDPQAEAAMAMMSGTMSRIGRVLGAMDFLDDAVTWSQVRDDGRTVFARTTTRYLAPEDR